jgi:hypothetical protein
VTASNQDRVVCHTGERLEAVADVPDVCTHTVAPPLYRPYANWVGLTELRRGSTATWIETEKIWLAKSTLGPPSYPKLPDPRIGKVSGTSRAEAVATSRSPDVFVEGCPVVRANDTTTQNHANTTGIVLPRALAAALKVPVRCWYLNRRYISNLPNPVDAENPVADFDRLRQGSASISAGQPTQHAFPQAGGVAVGPQQPATVYDVDIRGYSIPLYVPSPPPADTPSPQQITRSLQALPDPMLARIPRVTITPFVDPDAMCRADGSTGITCYPYWTFGSSDAQRWMDNAMLHEAGHVFSIPNLNWEATLGPEWRTVAGKDTFRPLLEPGGAEDFAESLRFYVLSQGTPCEQWMKALMPNRYAFLKKMMSPRDPFVKPR